MKDNFFGRKLSIFCQIKETDSNIQLVDGNESLEDDQKIADKLNIFFKNAVLNLFSNSLFK